MKFPNVCNFPSKNRFFSNSLLNMVRKLMGNMLVSWAYVIAENHRWKFQRFCSSPSTLRAVTSSPLQRHVWKWIKDIVCIRFPSIIWVHIYQVWGISSPRTDMMWVPSTFREREIFIFRYCRGHLEYKNCRFSLWLHFLRRVGEVALFRL